MSLVLTERHEHVGTITLNHYEKRNSLGTELVNAIIAALQAFTDTQARVVIIRAAAGTKIWSAGHDVKELPYEHRDPLGWNDPLLRLVRAIKECPFVVIALVEGEVWGGANEVVFSCDIVIVHKAAIFTFTPAKVGVPYNMTGLQNLMTVIPFHILKEMVFSAQALTADNAERLGIVNHVYDADAIERETYQLAGVIAQRAPLAIAAMKEALNILAGARDMSARTFERIQGLRRVAYDSEDYKEGLHAIFEKRPPVFTGK